MSTSLDASTVQRAIERAQALARELDFAINVAVVDEAGLLRGFLRMDGAVPGAIDVSIKKARTAALFRTDSLTLGAAAQPGGAIYTLEATNGGLISFGGGVVLHDEHGHPIGAVGVAGATVETDQTLALHAAGRA
ncbi:GlcG/HbpS family heme-binding protein [Pseudoxanthomonas winnipegensis]|uniref:Heme-binding protein n=1 Tax=Pseudoxanthomonas winnipegensis TaxID=2480810 RepID=A0A4Q8LZV8_9GAMM|nr:heme-binding protein [Pseudoxanthomonas winnipegensis]RZZ86927.1 heme-binding protein [Pseudoxanthomonas winnipegensis]TAA37857.1 heme-binding protein [Pseudoxanthomonas winnipegensis]